MRRSIELPHHGGPQGHLGTKRHSFTKFEVRDGVASTGDDGFLTGDQTDLLPQHVENLHVGDGFLETGVEHDFLKLGHLHHIPIVELLPED